MAIVQCKVEWTNTTFGTPPMLVTFDVDPLEESTDLQDIASLVAGHFDADLSTIRQRALGPGILTCSREDGGVYREATETIPQGGLTSTPAPAGWSFRIIKQADRPKSGRKGSLYLPGVPGSWMQDTGAISPTYVTQVNEAFETFRTHLLQGAPGVRLIQVHHRGRPSESIAEINELLCAPTASFLRKRYR